MSILDVIPGSNSPAPAGKRTRVGHISFLNCYPLHWGLTRSGALAGIELFGETPEIVSDALVDGTLSIGPITLIEYLRNSAELLLLPGLAIACDGPVLSCNLVSSVPLERLDGRKVGLGSTSRTTVLLAKLLLEERIGVRPDYFTAAPDLTAMLAAADAGVIIGDAGLRSYFHGGRLDQVTVHDTGQLWKEWTGLPMVFAVWAVRREFAARQPGTVARIHEELVAARARSALRLDTVAGQAAGQSSFTAAELEVYFRTLRYDLTEEAVEGIRLFGSMAAARGLVSPEQELALFHG